MSAGELLEFTRMSGAVVKAMRDCPIPIVAAVNGIAAGAGAVLAAGSNAGCWEARPSSRSSSRRSALPARTWAPPTTSPAWSGSAGRPSC